MYKNVVVCYTNISHDTTGGSVRNHEIPLVSRPRGSQLNLGLPSYVAEDITTQYRHTSTCNN
jgi:hypothetical protein